MLFKGMLCTIVPWVVIFAPLSIGTPLAPLTPLSIGTPLELLTPLSIVTPLELLTPL